MIDRLKRYLDELVLSGHRIGILCRKSSTCLYRQQSIRRMAVWSSFVVLGCLYLMWFLSQSRTLHYLTSGQYAKLNFALECEFKLDDGTPTQAGNDSQSAVFANYQYLSSGSDSSANATALNTNTNSSSESEKSDNPAYRGEGHTVCKPAGGSTDPAASSLSPTDILLNLVTTGTSLGSDKTQSTHDFAGLLSSVMMNGFPLLGLDDFVLLSDAVNRGLGPEGRGSIMNYAGYRDRFGNFLEVRSRQLRFVGKNCLTENLLRHWEAHSALFEQLDVHVYEDMEAALAGGMESVWAVIEIKPDTVDYFQGAYNTSYVEDSSTGGANGNVNGGSESGSSGLGDWYNAVTGEYEEEGYDRGGLDFDFVAASYRHKMDGTHSGRRAGERCDRFTRFQAVDAANNKDGSTTQPKAKSNKDRETPSTLSYLSPVMLTVRMHPSAIPDTRNFEFSPLKAGSPRMQSGQLL